MMESVGAGMRGPYSNKAATVAMAFGAAALVGGLHVLNHFLEAAATGRITTAPPQRGGGNLPMGLDPASRSVRRLCLPDGASTGAVTCGVSPVTRRVPGGTAYRVLTVAGDRFWVVLPDDLRRDRSVVAVQQAPIGWLGGRRWSEVQVTVEPPAGAVARLCDPEPCRPAAVARKELPGGAIHTAWRLTPRIWGVDVVTIEMSPWVLVFPEGPPEVTEFVARTLSWRVDRGFLVLQSHDPTYPIYDEWAGVRMVMSGNDGSYALTIVPGCGLSKKRPAVGGDDADRRLRIERRDGVSGGDWCAGGGFWVEARNVDGEDLRRLHEELVVRRE